MKRTKARFPIGADEESGVEPPAKELASAGTASMSREND